MLRFPSVVYVIRDILAYLSRTQGHGHTDSVIFGVKNTNGARIVTHDAKFGEHLKHTHDGVRWVTLEGIAKLPGSHRFPIVFDNAAIAELLSRAVMEIEQLHGEVVMAQARIDMSKEIHMNAVRRASEMADEIHTHVLRTKEMEDAIGDVLEQLEADEWGQDPEDAERYAARFVLDCVSDVGRHAELNVWRYSRKG